MTTVIKESRVVSRPSFEDIWKEHQATKSEFSNQNADLVDRYSIQLLPPEAVHVT